MMDRSVRIAAACSVLLGGVLLAMMFRHETADTGSPAPGTGDRLVLRRRMMPPSGGTDPVRRAGDRGQLGDPFSTSARSTAPGATLLTPMDPGQPPPELAKDYPAGGVPGTSRWGTSIRLSLPQASRPDEAARTHRVVDGDSLRDLADRYLGSADRYLEIYEANRDLLSSPEVLPIGAELTIPPRDPQPLPPSELTPDRPLAPIDHGDIQPGDRGASGQ